MRSICVFCGSSIGSNSAFQSAAVETAKAIARRNLRLVYGGGKVGLMGVLADTALAEGAEVIGVMPEFLMAKEIGHDGLNQLHIVSSMHERKTQMSGMADGFIALPGGYGTLEEFCEVLTWAQLGLHQKPCGLLNVNHYYDPLLQMFDQAMTENLMRPRMRSLVLTADTPNALLDEMERYKPQLVNQWMQKDTQV
ncbi:MULTISPECIES: TIGR00730 family Rossman fold protein [unclassified Leptolyngbya]|uniref:LOG family protein n=1 Tax=unclassified Leptolyngbya TaxID=2650499 RepID=UPI0016892AC0|nr:MULTISPECIES: TIGR00730 family Rossman fold protein [unclassified Leptolyngbya]MBD1910193.1 TIGR00730 family Rossman fold protein [Leptolyngbya sp. FACHB-8]MBD2153826.1 TIGR00730 family Rossman fold protein [Leptolyngbya sp. FACHB-16]